MKFSIRNYADHKAGIHADRNIGERPDLAYRKLIYAMIDEPMGKVASFVL